MEKKCDDYSGSEWGEVIDIPSRRTHVRHSGLQSWNEAL